MTHLRDGAEEVLESEHRLKQLVSVDIGPRLLDRVRVAWRARRELASRLGRVVGGRNIDLRDGKDIEGE